MNDAFSNAQLAQIACLWEATARKVGNVHPHADFDDLCYHDFLLSATVFSPEVEGLNYELYIQRTRQLVSTNTNLGIIILLTPLLAIPRHLPLQTTLPNLLREQSAETTCNLYRAIRLAKAGGLGTVDQHDILQEPTISILEAMKLAEDRDMIARQYCHDYAEIFTFGVESLIRGFEMYECLEAAIIHSQLMWLSEYPDSLIVRKNGEALGEQIRRMASDVIARGGLANNSGQYASVDLDGFLRADGHRRNPGTTADLIAASLYVALRENKLPVKAPFRWNVEDWL